MSLRMRMIKKIPRLEEDPEDPSKTPTAMIEENMGVLRDMRKDYEDIKG